MPSEQLPGKVTGLAASWQIDLGQHVCSGGPEATAAGRKGGGCRTDPLPGGSCVHTDYRGCDGTSQGLPSTLRDHGTAIAGVADPRSRAKPARGPARADPARADPPHCTVELC